MNYIALVKDTDTKTIKIINGDDYKTKKAFESDLRGNGYKIRFITTEEKFDEDCEKYHNTVEKIARRNKINREMKKSTARMLGMSVKEYEARVRCNIW